jgi:tripartite-type tricarboxylate transporter receptor subunit TctC
MKLFNRRAVVAGMGLAAMGVGGSLMTAAHAQDAWPSRPITIICPHPAGISTDVLTRALAQALSEALGQSVIVENRPGAAANIGTATAARAAPDGYTLLISTMGPMITSKYLYKSLPYDPDKAFAPVALVAASPMIITGSPKVPASNLAELLEHARKNPGKLSASTIGNGSQAHITLAMINKLAGTSVVHVPYRDVNQALPDLVSGDIHMGINYIPTFVGNVETGQLKGLAVTSRERLPDLPNVPTVAEAGFPGFEAVGWNGLFAPAGTPAPVVARLNKIVNDYLRSDEGKKQMAKQKLSPMGGSPEDMKLFLQRETARWVPVVKEANIKME